MSFGVTWPDNLPLPPARRVEQFSTMLSPLRGKGLPHRFVVPFVFSTSLFLLFLSQVSSTLPPSPSCPCVRLHSCLFYRTHIHILKQRPSFDSKKNSSLTDIPAFMFFLHTPYYHLRVQRCSQPPHDPPYSSQGQG